MATRHYRYSGRKHRSRGTRYGKLFRTRRGRYGRYKYVNGKRVSFVRSYSRGRRYKGNIFHRGTRY